MKLTKKLIKELEESVPEVGITNHGDYYSVYVDNPCGQDFSYEITKGKDEVEELITCCENYDEEDEFRAWYGANNGEPSNPGVLWDNCVAIGEALEKLKFFLQDSI